LKRCDDELKAVGASESWATCCIVMVRRDKESNKVWCYVANCGDTRAVININDKAERVSKDHKATDEEEILRVKAAGG